MTKKTVETCKLNREMFLNGEILNDAIIIKIGDKLNPEE